METRQPAKALGEFQQAVKLSPDDVGNYLNLAMYYLPLLGLRSIKTGKSYT